MLLDATLSARVYPLQGADGPCVLVHLESIADNARDVDLAIRWGFGWNEGPFEGWQAAGWKQVAEWVKEDIDAGNALSKEPQPDGH